MCIILIKMERDRLNNQHAQQQRTAQSHTNSTEESRTVHEPMQVELNARDSHGNERHKKQCHQKEQAKAQAKDNNNQKKTTQHTRQQERQISHRQQKQTLPVTQVQDVRMGIMLNMPKYFAAKMSRRLPGDAFNKYSIIAANDNDRRRFSAIFATMKETNNYDPSLLGLSQRQSRGIACILGNAIGDALGASTQFMAFIKKGHGIIKDGFADISAGIMNGVLSPRSGRVGIWTDDFSMALCMADSILLNDYRFIPQHFRYMFVLWLQHGLNNGGRQWSIGLGGNISISMSQFMNEQTAYAETGSQFNNGNGSLMRLSPVPMAYSNNIEQAIQYSGLQSLTTHNGLQAQHCSRLLANILVGLVNRPADKDAKSLIIQICDNFSTQVKSVSCLARGIQQPQQLYQQQCDNIPRFHKFNKSIEDRNWNWRHPSHTYSACRNKQQPGYIGSYCMDALAMALHTVMHTDSFKKVVIWNADMGGDCDTVGAIAGQIAGAAYGITSQTLKLYSEMVDYTQGRYETFIKAYKLVNQKKLSDP